MPNPSASQYFDTIQKAQDIKRAQDALRGTPQNVPSGTGYTYDSSGNVTGWTGPDPVAYYNQQRAYQQGLQMSTAGGVVSYGLGYGPQPNVQTSQAAMAKPVSNFSVTPEQQRANELSMAQGVFGNMSPGEQRLAQIFTAIERPASYFGNWASNVFGLGGPTPNEAVVSHMAEVKNEPFLQYGLQSIQKSVPGIITQAYTAGWLLGGTGSMISSWGLPTATSLFGVEAALFGSAVGLTEIVSVAKSFKEGNPSEGFGRITTDVIGLSAGIKGFEAGQKQGLPIEYTQVGTLQKSTYESAKPTDVVQKNIWEGVTIFGKPIVGKTGGSLYIGMPAESSVATQIKGITGEFQPSGRAPGVSIINRPGVYKELGIPLAKEQADISIRLMKFAETSKSPSSFEAYVRESKTFTPTEAETAIEFIKSKRGSIEEISGSFATQPQLPEGLQRPWGDIDIHLKPDITGSKGSADIFANELVSHMNKKGTGFRVSPTESPLIEKLVPETGQYVHAFDIKYAGQPNPEWASSLQKEGSWGFNYKKPLVNIEGMQSQSLPEQTQRKFGASNIFQIEESNVKLDALPHRTKDVGDAFATAKGLSSYNKNPASVEADLNRWVEIHPNFDWQNTFNQPVRMSLSLGKPSGTTIPTGYATASIASMSEGNILGSVPRASQAPRTSVVYGNKPSVSSSFSTRLKFDLEPSFSPSPTSASPYVPISPSIFSPSPSPSPPPPSPFSLSSLPPSLSLSFYSPSPYVPISPSIPSSPSPSSSITSFPKTIPPGLPSLGWGGGQNDKTKSIIGGKRRVRYVPTIVGLLSGRSIRREPMEVGVQAAGIRYPVKPKPSRLEGAAERARKAIHFGKKGWMSKVIGI